MEWNGSECEATDPVWDFWPSQLQFYPGVYVALHVTLLTYPLSTCTAEHSFSGIKRLQSPLRGTMRDERLSSLAILYTHKHKDVIDIDGIITEFVHLKGYTSRPLLVTSLFYPCLPWTLYLTDNTRDGVKEATNYCIFLLLYSLKMSCRKPRSCHFWDPKFKNFLAEHAPRLPQVCRVTSRILYYAADYQYLIAYEINAQKLTKRLGLEGVGGRGAHFKNCYCLGGVQFWYVILSGTAEIRFVTSQHLVNGIWVRFDLFCPSSSITASLRCVYRTLRSVWSWN